MPTYEYRCPEGHEFEKFQRMTDPPEAECPDCGREAERMLSGGAGLLFKGEGFYITDYRSDSYKKAARKDTGDAGSKSTKESDGASGRSESSGGDGKGTKQQGSAE